MLKLVVVPHAEFVLQVATPWTFTVMPTLRRTVNNYSDLVDYSADSIPFSSSG